MRVKISCGRFALKRLLLAVKVTGILTCRQQAPSFPLSSNNLLSLHFLQNIQPVLFNIIVLIVYWNQNSPEFPLCLGSPCFQVEAGRFWISWYSETMSFSMQIVHQHWNYFVHLKNVSIMSIRLLYAINYTACSILCKEEQCGGWNARLCKLWSLSGRPLFARKVATLKKEVQMVMRSNISIFSLLNQ